MVLEHPRTVEEVELGNQRRQQNGGRLDQRSCKAQNANQHFCGLSKNKRGTGGAGVLTDDAALPTGRYIFSAITTKKPTPGQGKVPEVEKRNEWTL